MVLKVKTDSQHVSMAGSLLEPELRGVKVQASCTVGTQGPIRASKGVRPLGPRCGRISSPSPELDLLEITWPAGPTLSTSDMCAQRPDSC